MDLSMHFRHVLEQLGEPVVYVHGSGTGASTGQGTGIFRGPYRELVLGGVPAVDASAPRVVVMSADYPGLIRGDTFTIRGTGYEVRVPQSDPTSGFTVCELEEI